MGHHSKTNHHSYHTSFITSTRKNQQRDRRKRSITRPVIWPIILESPRLNTIIKTSDNAKPTYWKKNTQIVIGCTVRSSDSKPCHRTPNRNVVIESHRWTESRSPRRTTVNVLTAKHLFYKYAKYGPFLISRAARNNAGPWTILNDRDRRWRKKRSGCIAPRCRFRRTFEKSGPSWPLRLFGANCFSVLVAKADYVG